MYVDDIILAGETQNIDSDVESTQQRSRFRRTYIFPRYVYLGCFQRECQISKDIVDNYTSMFESGISAGAMDKLPKPKLRLLMVV